MTRRQSGLFPSGGREAPALILSACTVTVAPGRHLPAGLQPQPISHTAMRWHLWPGRLLITYRTKSTSFTPARMLTCGTRPPLTSLVSRSTFSSQPQFPSESGFYFGLCPFPLLEVPFRTHSPGTRPRVVRPHQVLLPSLLSISCCTPLTPLPLFWDPVDIAPRILFQFCLSILRADIDIVSYSSLCRART